MSHSTFRRVAAALAVLASSFGSAGAQQPRSPAPQPPGSAVGHAARVLSATRTALGVDKAGTVKTLVATGRTERLRADNLVPIEFELDVEFPDRYVRRDEVPAQANGPTSTGFVADGLIQRPSPQVPQPDAQLKAHLIATKQDFARLALGLWADSIPSIPLTFSYAAEAAAPQGTADVLRVSGPDSFSALLFISTDTHLPLMLSWEAPPAAGPRGGTAATAPESRLYYADYREVDGMRLPFRIRRAVGQDTTEETTFDRFRLNTGIDPKKFALK